MQIASIQWFFNMFIQLLLSSFVLSSHGLELKQVIVFSRHNIRTPLSNKLNLWTPRKWPEWSGSSGDITPKGKRLEHAMGKYFSDWMIKENLFENNCPQDQAFVYANNIQRTKETAKSFVEGFGNCVDVYYKNTTARDPVFYLALRNTSTEFRETVLKDLNSKLSVIDLKNAYLELDRIADFGNSSYCRTENVCKLSEAKSEVVLELDEIPEITGRFRIGKDLVDAFLMAYYDGMPAENVAWGQIETEKQWETLLAITNSYLLRFENKILLKDVATNLLEYFIDIFKKGTKKFYLLIGHDTNIAALASAMGIKEYSLRDQFENTPIGGKVVFQKWYDEEKDEDLLKVEYVYQSSKQIRDGAEVSLQNPPLWQFLEMEECAVDKKGFCSWGDFISHLNIL